MKYAIRLYPSCFIKECEMIIDLPDDIDAEECIDSYLDAILNNDLRYNCEWEFV